MLSEIKVALRGLLKSPGFTVIAMGTVALAIAANSAVFSLVYALLVRPLPYQNPARLVLLWEQFAAQGLDRIPVSAPEFFAGPGEVARRHRHCRLDFGSGDRSQ